MTTRTYTLTFAGAGTGVLPAGVFFYVKTATAALTIRTRGSTSSPIEFADVGAGLKFGPVPAEKRWTYLDVESAVAQVVTVIVSDDAEVDIASTVNVAGNVQVSEVPSVTLATPARVSLNTATDVPIVAASATRRRVTIQNPSTNTESVNVGPTGQLSTTRGLEIEPGTSFEFVTSAAIFGRSVTGTPSVQALEET